MMERVCEQAAGAEVQARSARVSLRDFTDRDLDELRRLWAASRALHGAWHVRLPAERLRLRPRTRSRRRSFVLCAHPDGVIVGYLSLGGIMRGALQSALASYWIGAPHVRQGYMREGLALLLEFAFRSPERGGLGLHRVEALILPTNLASKRLAERVGMRFEGLSRRLVRVQGQWLDHERWAITAEDTSSDPSRASSGNPG
jgi:ribosomal-protein-alanine N-acetyltransferase